MNEEQLIAKAHDELRGRIGSYAEPRFEALIERGVRATVSHCQAYGAEIEAEVRSRKGLRHRIKAVQTREKAKLDADMKAETRGVIALMAWLWTCYQAWQFLKLVIRWAFEKQEAAIQRSCGMSK